MFAFIDWGNLSWPHYLALGGGVVLVLALLLYFLLAGAREGLQIPGIVAGSLGGLALGAGVGIVGMAAFGYDTRKPEASGEDQRANSQPQGNRGGMPGGMPGMGGRPNPKQQLAGLVRKLDLLTAKSLTVSLKPEEKKKVLDQLKDLGKEEELKDEDAQKRLDELVKDLKPYRETFEAAGYRWPGQGGGRGGPGGGRGGPGGGRPQPPANPFKQKDSGEALKALEQRLGK